MPSMVNDPIAHGPALAVDYDQLVANLTRVPLLNKQAAGAARYRG